MPDLDQLVIVECVCLGRRILTTNKLGESYIPLSLFENIRPDAWDILNKELSLFPASKKGDPAIVGGIFSISVTINENSGRIEKASVSSKKFIRMINNSDWLSILSAQDEINYTAYKAFAHKAKLNKISYIERDCERLNKYYKSLPYNERTGFELLVLKYIRGG